MTRRLSRSMEDYLKAIYQVERAKGYARVKDVASRMGVRPASASEAVSRLRSMGLVQHDRYGVIKLTQRGKHLAEGIMKRHELLTYFLHKILGLDREKAEKEACRLEHVISEETLERLVAFIQQLRARDREESTEDRKEDQQQIIRSEGGPARRAGGAA